MLEPNYYLLLFGTSVLNLHSALRGITASNNFKSCFGAGRRRFQNSIKVSLGPWRWEQNWYECCRSQVLRFGISSVLAAGQRRNFFLCLPGHHLNPERGRLMETLFRVEVSHACGPGSVIFLYWLCCSVSCKAKLSQPESPRTEVSVYIKLREVSLVFPAVSRGLVVTKGTERAGAGLSVLAKPVSWM